METTTPNERPCIKPGKSASLKLPVCVSLRAMQQHMRERIYREARVAEAPPVLPRRGWLEEEH